MEPSPGAPRALTSSPSTQSSGSSDIIDHPSVTGSFFHPLSSEPIHKTYPPNRVFCSPGLSYSQLQRLRRRIKMSDFLSYEAERVLMDAGGDPQALWAEDPDLYLAAGFQTPFIDDNAGWSHAHSDASGFDYFHPYPPNMPQQYMLPTQTDFSGSHEAYLNVPARSMSGSMPFDQSSISSSNVSAPSTASLHAPLAPSPLPPPSLQVRHPTRSISRSPSPSPSSDLQNYGNLNADRRTWRCAYPGCHSKAVFVRPCDLRKHFHRHEKKFFCRYDGCAQSESGTRKAAMAAAAARGGAAGEGSASLSSQNTGTTGSFSSKKDRARHEAKHNPGVECEWQGCERIFSRVDNMKDHYRRIHLKEKERRRLSGGAGSRRSDED